MIKNLIVVSIILLLWISCTGHEDDVSTRQDASRPNINFIMSDDHTSQAISAYGGNLGYNFIGNISHLVAYDEVITKDAIKLHANGEIPGGGNAIVKWGN